VKYLAKSTFTDFIVLAEGVGAFFNFVKGEPPSAFQLRDIWIPLARSNPSSCSERQTEEE
jgi:hypothetical protein